MLGAGGNGFAKRGGAMKEPKTDFGYFLIGLGCIGVLLLGLIALPVALIIATIVVIIKMIFI